MSSAAITRATPSLEVWQIRQPSKSLSTVAGEFSLGGLPN